MKNQELTPIADARLASNRVDFKLALPSWLHSETIGVNLSRLHRTLSWGGIRKVTLQGIAEGRTFHAVPNSVMGDGSITGSIVESKTQTQDLESIELPGKMPIRNAYWTNLHIRVNLEDLRNKIARKMVQ